MLPIHLKEATQLGFFYGSVGVDSSVQISWRGAQLHFRRGIYNEVELSSTYSLYKNTTGVHTDDICTQGNGRWILKFR